MADDIVTRLRAAARTGDLPLGASFDCDGVADEIERLRAEVERLRAAGDALAEECWSLRHLDDAVKAWQEACRA